MLGLRVDQAPVPGTGPDTHHRAFVKSPCLCYRELAVCVLLLLMKAPQQAALRWRRPPQLVRCVLCAQLER